MTRDRFNPKRRLLSMDHAERMRGNLEELASRVRYGGNPEHKRDPGDFALQPPHAAGRPRKTLCDDAGITLRARALELLREGLRRGMVDARFHGEWLLNVWAVAPDGTPLEATRESAGCYHGYPMPENDPLRQEIAARWRLRRG
jgi:hypothetical protein